MTFKKLSKSLDCCRLPTHMDSSPSLSVMRYLSRAGSSLPSTCRMNWWQAVSCTTWPTLVPTILIPLLSAHHWALPHSPALPPLVTTGDRLELHRPGPDLRTTTHGRRARRRRAAALCIIERYFWRRLRSSRASSIPFCSSAWNLALNLAKSSGDCCSCCSLLPSAGPDLDSCSFNFSSTAYRRRRKI